MEMGRRAAADRDAPLCRLVSFAASDGVALSGLLYQPRRVTRRAAVFLHGTGGASVFDSRRTNILATELLARGITLLAFNNRGSHLVRRLRLITGARRGRLLGGMAYELIRECVFDIDGASRFLRRRGFGELFLIGHSTGANKVAVYDWRKQRSPFRSYVMLAGGDDTGLMYRQLGERRFAAALRKARERIRARRGEELVPRSLSPLPMSWRSLHDMINPDGDYNVFPFGECLSGVRLSRRPRFRHVRAIRKPSLYLYGEHDEYCYGDVAACVRILSQHVGANAEIAIMEGADHGFGGRERELGATVSEWLLS